MVAIANSTDKELSVALEVRQSSNPTQIKVGRLENMLEKRSATCSECIAKMANLSEYCTSSFMLGG